MVESLQLSNVSLINRTPGAVRPVLTNRGKIGSLAMTNIYAKAEASASSGAVVWNAGLIERRPCKMCPR